MNKKEDKLLGRCTLSLLITSVCALLCCAVCLVSTTWAWMNADSSYEGTKIKLSDKCEATLPPESQSEENQTTTEEGQAVTEESQPEESQTPSLPDEAADDENA